MNNVYIRFFIIIFATNKYVMSKKHVEDEDDGFVMPTIHQARVSQEIRGLERPISYTTGSESRRVCSVALDVNKHADLLELIDEIKNIKSCSMGKAVRELLYYGLIEVNKLKKEGKYNISLVDKA